MACAIIQAAFFIDFGVKFLLAPRKLAYLNNDWLAAIALFVPALRVFQMARVVRAARGIQMARVVTSLNRGLGRGGTGAVYPAERAGEQYHKQFTNHRSKAENYSFPNSLL